MPTPRFETLFDHPDASLTHARQLVVIRWHRAPSQAIVEQLGPRVANIAARYPRELRFIAIARGFSGVPDDATRAAGGRLIRQIQPDIRAAAFTVLDQGFQGAAMRAVIIGLLAIVRPSSPVKVFGTFAETARWMHPQLPPANPLFESPDSLCTALELLGAPSASRPTSPAR